MILNLLFKELEKAEKRGNDIYNNFISTRFSSAAEYFAAQRAVYNSKTYKDYRSLISYIFK